MLKSIIATAITILFSISTASAYDSNKTIHNFSPSKQELKDGAVVLRKEKLIRIDKSGHQTTNDYYLIAILDNQAANDYGQLEFTFDEYYGTRKLDYARVITKDGNISSLKKDAVQIVSAQINNSYSDLKRIVFSLPALKANTFIEFELSGEKNKSAIPNEVSGIGSFMLWQSNHSSSRIRVDSVRKSSYIITVDKSKELFFNVHEDAKLTKNTKRNSIKYTWTIENLKRVEIENSTLESYKDLIPEISYSTIASWKILGDFFYEKYKRASTPSDKIKKLAESITKKDTNDLQKAKSIFNYMQKNIKYIYAHFGRGGITPHNADEVIKNAYGDCKDQSILYIALLHSLGIEANPALVNSYPGTLNSNDVATHKHFNHLITYIPKLNTWVDTIGTNDIFPGISWRLGGKNTFILTQNGGELKRLPEIDTQNTKLNIILRVEGNNTLGTITYMPSQQESSYLKSFIANTQNSRAKLEKDSTLYYNNVVTDSYEILNFDNPEKPLVTIWKFHINEISDKLSSYGFSSVASLFLTKILQTNALDQPNHRVHGFKYGFKVNININTKIILPSPEYRLLAEPNRLSIDNDFYKYSMTYNKNNNGLDINETILLRNNKVPKNKYLDFYNATKTILKDIPWLLVFNLNTSKSKEMELKNAVKKHNDSEAIIALTEYYIDNLKYAKAKEAIRKLIMADPNNAEAHYKYAVILGYMDDFTNSKNEFEKAKKLGYKK